MTFRETRTLIQAGLSTWAVLAAVATFAASAHAQTGSSPQTGPRAVGVSILHLHVANLDASLALYRDVLGMEITTPPGQPRANPGLVAEPGAMMRTVILRAPGGPFSLELVENSEGAASSDVPGPILGATVYLTVQDIAQTVAFYNRAFGFGMAEPAAARPAGERIQTLFGDTSLATMRSTRGTFPGSEFTINFQEFQGPDRKPARHRVQDPGGPIASARPEAGRRRPALFC